MTGISSESFRKVIRSEIDKKVIVAFLAPKFSIEDISQCQGDTNCLSQVSQEFTYFSYVENPGMVLMEEAKTGNSSLETLIDDIHGGQRFLYVNLEEKSDNSRLSELYNSLSKRNPNVIFIYTGYQSRHNLTKRSIDHSPLESKHILIAAEKISERIGNSSETSTDIHSIATKVIGSSLYATLFPSNFTLKFILQGNVWSLSSAIKNDTFYKIPNYVSALDSYSYRCASNLTFVTRENVIKIVNSQILVSFKEDHPKFYLRKVVYCDSYVTPGILSGLIFSTIFIGVLLLGLLSIASIRTMDRFDDQRNKGFILVQDY